MFDCDFRPTSSQASIYEVFMVELWKQIKPFPNINFSFISLHNTQQSGFNYIHKAFEGSAQHKDTIEKAWKEMKKELKGRFGTDD
jgi:hypothetical protein